MQSKLLFGRKCGAAIAYMYESLAVSLIHVQVDGCTADLTQEEKAYCQKKRICSYHMCAEIIMRPGDSEMYRFCFQVGKHAEATQVAGETQFCMFVMGLADCAR